MSKYNLKLDKAENKKMNKIPKAQLDISKFIVRRHSKLEEF